jgi:hypothetical protein
LLVPLSSRLADGRSACTHTGSYATTKPHFMARSIKIGDEITTSILNSVETTITANLLSGDGKPNFAACKAVATRLQNYVLACEKVYLSAKAEAEAAAKAEETKVSAVADLQAQLAELTAKLSELTEPKAPAKPAPKKSTTSKKAKPKKQTRRRKTTGQKLASKAGQGRKSKNTVLEAKQQAAFVSDFGI